MSNDFLNVMRNGDSAFEKQNYNAAIKFYQTALTLIDSNDYDSLLQVEIALADTYFVMADYDNALLHLYKVIEDDDMLNSSFINYQLGKCLYAQGAMDKAKLYLLRSYELDGELAFADDEMMLRVVEEVL